MKAVILARVSTIRQEKEGLSIQEIQLPRLRTYCEEKGMEIDREFVFSESASMKIRKKFDEMIAYIKANPSVKAIVTYRVDRITRNYRDAVLLDDLRVEKDIQLHFVDDRLVLHRESKGSEIQQWDLKVFLAKQHINNLHDHSIDTRLSKFEKGELAGPAPFGYKNTFLDDNPKLKWVEPKEPQATIVKKMYELYSSGNYSMDTVREKIKEQFNHYLHKGNVDVIFRRKFYYGILEYNGMENEHRYEKLITKETYDRVQEIKSGYNKKHSKYAGKPYVYRGLIKCAICGCSITPEMQKGHVYYHCTGYKGKHSKTWIREEDLTNHFVSLYKSLELPTEVAEDLSKKLKEANRDKTYYNKKLLENYSSELQKYQTRLSKMYEDKLDGSITDSEYTERKNSYQEEVKKIQRKIEQLSKADEEYYILAESILSLAQRAGELFESSEMEQKRQIINLTLQNLTLDEKKLSYDLIKPFDVILKSQDSHNWLRDQDSNLEPNG